MVSRKTSKPDTVSGIGGDVAGTSTPAPAVTAKSPKRSGDKLRARVQALESVPMYWIAVTVAGVYWVLATGQAAAREAAGDIAANSMQLYQNAGEALRAAEMASMHTGKPILDVAGLEAAAKADPEPENPMVAWWAAKKGAAK